MNDGSYEEIDGRPAVRFERVYAHPVERVWAALTQPADLEHWFPDGIEADGWSVGDVLRFASTHVEPFHGEVLVAEPPHRLHYSWGPNELRFELSEEDDGCRLTMVELLEARDQAARDAAGWEVCLAQLETRLGGGDGTAPHGPTPEWRELYDAYRADGMPSGAWIPEGA